MLTPNEEIEIRVYEKFPVMERERNCWQFAASREAKRAKYRKLLQETITEETFNNFIQKVDDSQTA